MPRNNRETFTWPNPPPRPLAGSRYTLEITRETLNVVIRAAERHWMVRGDDSERRALRAALEVIHQLPDNNNSVQLTVATDSPPPPPPPPDLSIQRIERVFAEQMRQQPPSVLLPHRTQSLPLTAGVARDILSRLTSERNNPPRRRHPDYIMSDQEPEDL